MWWKRKCVRRHCLQSLIFAPRRVRMNAAASSFSLSSLADWFLRSNRTEWLLEAASVRHAALCSLLLAAHTRVWLIAAAFLLSLITPAGQRSSWQYSDARARPILQSGATDALSHQWNAGGWVAGKFACEARLKRTTPTLLSPLLFHLPFQRETHANL